MYNFISNLIANQWLKNKHIEYEDIDIYKYGIEILLSSIVGALLVMILGSAFFNPVYSIIYLVVMIPLRCYCGGFHAKSYLGCNTIMMVSFMITSLFSKLFLPNLSLLIIGLIICNMIIAIFAPVDNENKRLTKYEKKRCKLVSIIISGLISTIILFVYYFKSEYYSMIFYSLCLVVFLLILGKEKNRFHLF